MRKRLSRILISAFSVMICTAYLGCGGGGGGTSGDNGSPSTTTTVTTTTTSSGTSASTSTSTTTSTTTVATTTTTTTTVPPAALWMVPDTGQTQSYTDTFGEDHDYTIHPPSYIDNGNGTISDVVTGLVWQKEDDNVTRSWADAGLYCDNLVLGGQSDWRLPNVKELTDIVNFGTFSPAINVTYFPNTNSSYYWSSPSYAYNSSYAWHVDFYKGHVVPNNNNPYDYYVRCVRGGQ